MYPHDSRQLSFSDFVLPFGGHLSANNRWVKLPAIVPWQEAEETYRQNFADNGQGAPAKPCRMVLGSLIIQTKIGCTDREFVDQITENPYLQFFIGLEEFTDVPPFHASSLVDFRKRFGMDIINELNELTVVGDATKCIEESAKNDDSPDLPGGPGGNSGKLLIDATCTPADITFPTDIKILGKARENLEKILDVLRSECRIPGKKPRDYRRKAYLNYLDAAKAKNLSKKKRRKAIRKQLSCIERNLKHVRRYVEQHPDALTYLNRQQYKNLLVAGTVAYQQRKMWKEKSNKVDNRIVSNSQPHIRPMVRGKSGVKTEFGAMISISVFEGYAFLDRLEWDKYNESRDLPSQCEEYRREFGNYPKSVHADKIYRNNINRKWCSERGIRMSGSSLGRPPKDEEKLKERSFFLFCF